MSDARNPMALYLLAQGWIVHHEMKLATMYRQPKTHHKLLIPHPGQVREGYHVNYAVRLLSRWLKRPAHEIRDDIGQTGAWGYTTYRVVIESVDGLTAIADPGCMGPPFPLVMEAHQTESITALIGVEIEVRILADFGESCVIRAELQSWQTLTEGGSLEEWRAWAKSVR
ncbi:MAG: hypothetical protein KAI66_27585 [Lentisphaeria bacterium]|nr:hypothetical protein [Lentisphaeria bacterium]